MFKNKKIGPLTLYYHRPNTIKKKNKNILVMGQTGLGALLMATPFLHYLRIFFPDYNVNLFSNPLAIEVFKHSSDIDALLITDHDMGEKDYSIVKPVLENQHYEMFFSLQDNAAASILGFLLKIPIRVGFASDENNRYFTNSCSIDKENSKTLQLLYLLSPFCSGINDLTRRLHLYLSAEDSARAQQFMKRQGVVDNEVLIGLNVGGRNFKEWSHINIIETGRFLEEKYEARCVVFGGSVKNSRNINKIAKSISNKTISVYNLNILETAEIIRRCKFVLTDDSDLSSLCAAVGTPTLILFRPGIIISECKPEGKLHLALQEDYGQPSNSVEGIRKTSIINIKTGIENLCELIDRHKSESKFIIEDDYYKTFIATSNPDESAKHANFKGPMQPGKNESEYNECADYSRRILNGETLVFRVRLDIARMCNFKCQFCCSSFHLVPNINKNNQIIPLETIRKLSVQFKKLGVRHVNLYGGGEPTLHPQFAEVLEILAENDFRFQLITNGSGLNSIVNNTIVKHHSKFDTIRISLPGLSVRSHRFATKSISYNKITANAQELIKEIRCYRDIPQIGLYVPVMGSFTEEEIDSFLNFAITARFDWVFFREDFRFPAVNSVQEFNPIREHQAVRDLVTKVSARYPGFKVFYSTPIIVPNKSSICYFQLTDRCLSFDPQSKKLIVVNCEHLIPPRLNDFPPDGTYELIVPDSFYEICKNQVQFFSSKNNLPCPRPDFCYTSRRNELIDHKLKAN